MKRTFHSEEESFEEIKETFINSATHENRRKDSHCPKEEVEKQCKRRYGTSPTCNAFLLQHELFWTPIDIFTKTPDENDVRQNQDFFEFA